VLCTDHQQLVVSGVNGNSQLGMPSYQNNGKFHWLSGAVWLVTDVMSNN
jgi:hypothetical protein